MTWYDPIAKRERSTLPHKVFFIWGWPLIRFLMFHCMSSEQAHYFGIHIGIPFAAWVDRIWQQLVFIVIGYPLIGLLRLAHCIGWLKEPKKEEDAAP